MPFACGTIYKKMKKRPQEAVVSVPALPGSGEGAYPATLLLCSFKSAYSMKNFLVSIPASVVTLKR